MRGKNVVIILLTVVLFLSVSVLGVATVYRVSDVTVNAPVVSDEAKTEAQALQARLLQAYDKQSTFFVDDTLAQEIVADFPYFRITSFQRAYPNRLVVEITEDAEVYGVRFDDGYYILNASGTVLGIREDYNNRTDGESNILIFSTPTLPLVAQKGQPLTGDSSIDALFAVCARMNELFVAQPTISSTRGIRGNVISIEIIKPVVAESEITYKFSMSEGVCIYIRNPLSRTLEKAEKAVNAYLNLNDRQKLTGMIAVFDDETQIKDVYYQDIVF